VKIPACMLLHPVGVGGTRAMNVLSAKLWLRALVDLLPDVAIAAPWLPYAEAMIDRERGLRDALLMVEHCDAVVAVGGEFTRGMIAEWEHAARRKLVLVDLTRSPMPSILTYETFTDVRSISFRAAVTAAFVPIAEKMKVAA
jgi:hypothetical protein